MTAVTTTNPAALAGWVKSKDIKTGRIFYANQITRQSQWDPPSDWVEVELPPPPPPPAESSASSTCSSLGCCGHDGAAAVPSNNNASSASSCGASISAAAAAVDHHHHGGDNADRDMAGFSQLTLDEMPEAKEAQGNIEEQNMRTLQVSHQTSAAARRAAVPFLSSMILPGEKSKNDEEERRRSSSCNLLSGHRARIMGLSFSECGQFLATAAEDSTIRIWDVTLNLLVATLLQHDDKYECTRVAWASSTWVRQNHRHLALAAAARGAPRGMKKSAITTTTTTNRTGSVGYLPICAPIGGGAAGGGGSAKKKHAKKKRAKKKSVITPGKMISAGFNNNNKGAATTTAAAFNYILATGGADGVVYLWGCQDPNDDWTVVATLDHATYSHFFFQATQQHNDCDDKPQVYALQFIDHWQGLVPSGAAVMGDDDDANNSTPRSILMTSSDDHVHLWEVEDNQKSAKKCAKVNKNDASAAAGSTRCLKEVFSLRFGATHSYGHGVSIGHVTGKKGRVIPTTTTDMTNGGSAAAGTNIGTLANDHVFGGTDRNPQGLIFVFDACYCPANGLLGVALSDGTLRLIHGQGVCLSILHLPPGIIDSPTHLTSLAWDSSGRHLAKSVASGHVITWAIDWLEDQQQQQQQHHSSAAAAAAPTRRLYTTCRAVLEGGHERGRPLFGVQYCGTDDSLLLSWGVDGRLCLWDAHSEVEQVGAYLATLLDNKDYPIYCVSLSSPMISDDDDKDYDCMVLAVGGGGSDGGGLKGIPVYLYNIPRSVHVDQELKKHKSQDDQP